MPEIEGNFNGELIVFRSLIPKSPAVIEGTVNSIQISG